MTGWWAMAMLVSVGPSTADVAPFAWKRAQAWRSADPSDLRLEFEQAMGVSERAQRVVRLLCVVATVGFALSTGGAARLLALAATGLLAVLIGTGALLTPIERRLAASGSELSSAEIERLRSLWFRRQFIRAVVALAALLLIFGAVLAHVSVK